MPRLSSFLITAAVVLFLAESPIGAVPAAVSPPALCIDAARDAALRHGIPPTMMHAITLVETRREVGGASGPWPWTLNVKGKGYWYETRAGALAHAEREIGEGRLSVDLGCFQLNYRWHGENFATLDDMLEPVLAADYAARFLAGLYAETGDWMRAAGLYHSRTPVYARRYRGLVGRTLASLEQGDGLATAPLASPRPGPRVPPQAASAQRFLLAAARISSDPVRAAAPGSVMLRMFADPARPLLAAPGLKP